MFNMRDALVVFLAVLAWGTLWRLASAHLTVNSNTQLAHLGEAMAYQY